LSYKWWEFDIGWMYIQIMAYFWSGEGSSRVTTS